MYRLEDYDYALPEHLIAQQPLAERDRSRLLGLDRTSGKLHHGRFHELLRYFASGDVLVLNDTRVIPGRLLGRKESGGKIELLIMDYVQGLARGSFTCMVKAAKRPAVGSRLFFEPELNARVTGHGDRFCEVVFEADPADLMQRLLAVGHVPLPPYIRRRDTPRDRETYQTVYAARGGAIAAPTAGLHFTPALLAQLAEKGVRIVPITLHVGYGTFVPVRVADIRDHQMHAEWFELGEEAAAAVNAARRNGRRVTAVGTTCVRTLEYCAAERGMVAARSGACDLFIYPGYAYKVVDAMITNFHLPKSTLMMLVSAFAGRETIMRAYAEAIRAEYRFFSYGDAMIIFSSESS
jgi:S-adenosylmethionine:tRNA ribosyltransferase-isomerase